MIHRPETSQSPGSVFCRFRFPSIILYLHLMYNNVLAFQLPTNLALINYIQADVTWHVPFVLFQRRVHAYAGWGKGKLILQ